MGVKIRFTSLLGFFKELKGNLGFEKVGNLPDKFIWKNIVKMNL
jgi:hypothetical protein